MRFTNAPILDGYRPLLPEPAVETRDGLFEFYTKESAGESGERFQCIFIGVPKRFPELAVPVWSMFSDDLAELKSKVEELTRRRWAGKRAYGTRFNRTTGPILNSLRKDDSERP